MVKINSDKDMKIEALQLKLPEKKFKSRNFLQIYTKFFTEHQITQLENVSAMHENDATFIRLIVKFLFADEDEIPTLKVGIKHNRPKLQREIHDVINGMFKLRLQLYCNNDNDFAIRYKRGNTHVSNALNSLVQKKLKYHNNEKNMP